MYGIIFQTHKISVLVFLLLYLIKTILLLANKQDGLQKLVKVTKVPEMIISFLFLVTGIYLSVSGAFLSTFFYIKLAAVFISIPLAIIGFKKGNKILASLAMILIIAAYGLAEMNKAQIKKQVKTVKAETPDQQLSGLTIYNNGCAPCHGAKGDAGVGGAGNLTASKLSDEEIYAIIKSGKNSMPAFGYLSENEINEVTVFVKTLRN